MRERLKALQHRKHELIHQANCERKAFSEHFEVWEKPLSWADKGVDTYHFLKNNPLLWTSAFAALAHYKPKLASKVLAVCWGAMKIVKSAKNLV
jgi:hypothetical protein